MPELSGSRIPCALCGGADTGRLYTKFGWGIERCRRCGLVYANPRAPESEIVRRYSRDYFWKEYLPAIGAADGNVTMRYIDERHAPILDLMADRLPGARRLLEIGTGAGLFLKAAERAGLEVAGLELSESAAEFARDRLGLDVRQERAEAMTAAPASFDVACMFDVIEHLFNPREVLQATRRALETGGLIVVSTPNFDAVSRQAIGADWSILSPLEHLYYFTEATLAAMLEATGFGDVRFERTFSGWGSIESMNYNSTHAPGHWRATAYRAVVHGSLGVVPAIVKRLGRADALMCSAIAR